MNLATEVAFFGWTVRQFVFFQLRVSPTHHKLQKFYKQVQIASLFASFLNMLPRASAAGVSAFTYQSIDFYTNTPYGKRKEPFRSIAKNDLCMSAPW